MTGARLLASNVNSFFFYLFPFFCFVLFCSTENSDDFELLLAFFVDTPVEVQRVVVCVVCCSSQEKGSLEFQSFLFCLSVARHVT